MPKCITNPNPNPNPKAMSPDPIEHRKRQAKAKAEQRARLLATLSPDSLAARKRKRNAQQSALRLKQQQSNLEIQPTPNFDRDDEHGNRAKRLKSRAAPTDGGRCANVKTLAIYSERATHLAGLMNNPGTRRDNKSPWRWAVRDPQLVLDFIDSHTDWAESTKNTYRVALASILKTNKAPLFVRAREQYSHAATAAAKAMREGVADNRPRPSQLGLYVEWPALKQSLADNCSPIPMPDSAYGMICLMYTRDFPPRRLDDFEYMRISNETILHDEPSDANYLVLDDESNPKRLVFNVYKTRATYKQQHFELAAYPDLQNAMKTYVQTRHITRPGMWLFGVLSHTKKRSNFHAFVKSAFERHTAGKHAISTEILRRSYISNFTFEPKTEAQLNKVAFEMAHSRALQSTYRVVGDDGTDSSEN